MLLDVRDNRGVTRHLSVQIWDQPTYVFGLGLPELLILLFLGVLVTVVPVLLLWVAYAVGKQRGAAEVMRSHQPPD